MPKLLPLLECLLCSNKFTASDVEKGLYFLETKICKACYVKMQKQDAGISCFGKLPKKGSPGFSQENIACTTLCPDRKICGRFITKLTRRNSNG